MTREQVIKAVLVCMDDAVTDNSIEVVANPVVDQILDAELSNAFKFLPAYMLPQKSFLSQPGVDILPGIARVKLPDDFLRFVKYRTTKHRRPLSETDLVAEGSPQHKLMYGQYTGGIVRPKACITLYEGSKWLEYTTPKDNSGTALEALYVSVPTSDDVTTETISPVAWYVASSALAVMGEAEASKFAMSKVQEFVTIKQ